MTNKELQIFERLSPKRKIEFLAGRFAAKEAFSKAYGTGIGRDLSFRDIEIETDARANLISLIRLICVSICQLVIATTMQ